MEICKHKGCYKLRVILDLFLKCKAIPLQAWRDPEDSRRMRLSDFKTIGTRRWQGCQPYARPPLPPRNISRNHFCYRLSRPKGHSAAGRFMSMTNSNDTIGNRTLDLLTCSAVPQPTAPPRGPIYFKVLWKSFRHGFGQTTVLATEAVIPDKGNSRQADRIVTVRARGLNVK